MELQVDPYEKQDTDLLVHDAEYFTVSNEDFVDEMSRLDVKDCASLKKENDERAFLLYDILTPDECQYVIDSAEKLGFEDLLSSASYRTNQRVVLSSKTMSDRIWERINGQIKPIVLEEGDYKQTVQGYKLEGVWEPVGLNIQWRLSKYFPGNHFGPHYDGSYIHSFNLRSLKTFNLYLNANFTGGTTNFVKDSQKSYLNTKGLNVAESENVTYRVKPEAGMALIFNHYLLHEGEELLSGVKYLLRSDIMFRRTDVPLISDDETKAFALVEDAKQLESSGRLNEACALYARAFKLCPDVEKTI